MDRQEYNEAERVESNSNKSADLGDLSQLGQHAERQGGDKTELTADSIAKSITDFAGRVAKSYGAEPNDLMDTVNYFAEKGEPLYVLIRDALKK